MLVKLLSEDDALHLLKIGSLLSIADKTLLWDGKKVDVVTPKTDMSKITFVNGEAESKLLIDWYKESKFGSNARPTFFRSFGNGGIEALTDLTKSVEKLLTEELENVPIHKNTEDSAERLMAVTSTLQRLLEEKPKTTPYAARVIVYELLMMALAAGGISQIENQFLALVKQHYEIGDVDYEEILERAESMFREVQKTIALILE